MAELILLKIQRIIMLLTGQWEFEKYDKPHLVLYKIYSYFIFWHYFFMTQFIILSVPTEWKCKSRVIEHSGFYIQYTNNLIMMILSNFSSMKKVFQYMLDYEKTKIRNASAAEQEIYLRYAKVNNRCSLLMASAVYIAGAYWFPVSVRQTYVGEATETCPLTKGTIYQIRHPFGMQNHNWLVVINDAIFFVTVLNTTIFREIMAISVVYFMLSQIKILQQNIKDLEIDSSALQKLVRISSGEALSLTAKKCIKRHQHLTEYIFSLALADLLVIITVIPFTSILYTVESWPWGVVVCKLSESVKDISIGVSVFTLTALSAERYCAIVNPLRRLQTKPMTVISAGMIWLLATGFALPDAICSTLNYHWIPDQNTSIAVCSPYPNYTHSNPYAQYSIAVKSLIYYFIPLTIIAVFYVLMAIRLHHSANEMPGEIRGTQSVAQARARKHVARMVLIFVFLFFICFLPHHVFMLWFHLYPNALDEYNEWWHSLKIIGFCLSFVNSCVNPVALYCVSGVFRAHFNRYLCCRDPRWPRNTLSTANCETSFNSTYRRHTQNTTLENQSIYRKGTIARKNLEDTTSLTMNMANKNESNDIGIKNTMIMRSQMEIDKGGYCS